MILQPNLPQARASILGVNDESFGLIRLEGGCNFRQISGYSTHDGRRIRSGALFRSGVLAYFSPPDHLRLSALGIRTIVDLRSSDERRREPTCWCDDEATTLSVDDETAPASLLRMALKTTPTELSMRQAMLDTYRAMPAALADRLVVLFGALHRGDTPLLIHCSAGKDRTGFAVAILLGALGVPRATILEDYLYTNQAVDLERFVSKHYPGARRPDRKNPLSQLPEGVRKALLHAHAEYLQAAFASLEESDGSLEGYLERRLAMDSRKLVRLRDQLLESRA
jgi:protein-tyrosine phosphatase